MKELNHAITMHRQGKMAEAEHAYNEALKIDFDRKEAIYLLGTVNLQKGRFGLAAQLFMRVLDSNPDHFESWNNLGNCYKQANKDKEAEVCFQKALNIKNRAKQEYADIYNNLGTIYVNDGAPEKGIPYIDKALAIEPDHADANWNKSLLYLEMGEFGKGFDLYHWGFSNRTRLFRDYGNSIKPWDGTKGQTVIVWGEQGIGDELMFASILPDMVRDCKQVIFDCHPRLINIFRASFPEVICYPTRKDNFIEWPGNHKIDAKIAIGDLGKYYRQDIKDFPPHCGYLKSDEKRRLYYRKKLSKLGDRLKVGISWTGGYKKTRTDYRTINLEKWQSILEQDCDFVSLQYTPDAYRTVSEVEDKYDIKINHWPSSVEHFDYNETAALVSELDLVITVNTSIHHLAGGLGVECWTLTPKARAWRYFSPDGVKNPWYPSVRQFQQKEKNKWGKVLKEVSSSLAEKAENHKEANLRKYKKYLEEKESIKKRKKHDH